MRRRPRARAATRSALSLLGSLGTLALAAAGAGAQLRVDDLVFTGGLAMEAYRGNFSAVTVAVVDSTDRAAAAVGQFGTFGRLNFLETPDGQTLDLTFDGGLRQFAAVGFELRDYAPREWASRVQLDYGRSFKDLGRLGVRGSYRGRWVEDRPPLPLFLQPAHESFRGAATLALLPIEGVAFDAELDAESTDYEPPRILSQLDLLDRKSQGVEVGAEVGGTGVWSVRFHTGFRWSQYERQGTSLPEDPFRRDRTVSIGATWAAAGSIAATLGVEGTVNRSNSRRPEYDAVSVRGDLTAPLPYWDLGVSAFALLTWKSYVQRLEFARLVPGEEADNASVVYVDLIRPLAENLDGVLRFGWTRAETDIGESYYRRVGATFLMNFRPGRF